VCTFFLKKLTTFFSLIALKRQPKSTTTSTSKSPRNVVKLTLPRPGVHMVCWWGELTNCPCNLRLIFFCRCTHCTPWLRLCDQVTYNVPVRYGILFKMCVRTHWNMLFPHTIRQLPVNGLSSSPYSSEILQVKFEKFSRTTRASVIGVARGCSG